MPEGQDENFEKKVVDSLVNSERRIAALETQLSQAIQAAQSAQQVAQTAQQQQRDAEVRERQRSQAQGINLSVPSFDGTGDVRDWIERAEQIFHIKGIKDNKGTIAAAVIEGAARQHLREEEWCEYSWESIQTSLLRRFSKPGHQQALRDELASLRYHSGQDIEAHFSKFLKVMADVKGASQEDLLWLWNNTLPPAMKAEVLFRSPSSVREAMEIARCYVAAGRTGGWTSRTTATSGPLESTPMELDAMWKKPFRGRGGGRGVPQRQLPTQTQQRNNGCHICGAQDHWRSQCPRRNQTGRGESNRGRSNGRGGARGRHGPTPH